MTNESADDFSLKDWPVAILAGGLATRLGSAVQNTPKALLPVGGRPFVVHQLQLLAGAGFRRIVLCVAHLGEQIEAAIGDGTEFGLDITYSFDGPVLRGTGGALKRASEQLGSAFAILYGDSYLQVDYKQVIQLYLQSGRAGLITVHRNRGRWDKSNVWVEHGEIRMYDKMDQLPQMEHIEYGFALLRADTLTPYPDNEPFDLADVYQNLIASRDMAVYEVTKRFYEIGSKKGWAELDALLQQGSGSRKP
jgi:NDP-sugar pyrophosphorylase family protein